MKSTRLKIIGLTTCLLVGTSQAGAAIVTFNASGELTSVDTSLADSFNVGQAYSFSVSYDTSTLDRLSADTGYGIYNNAITSMSATIGSYSVSWSPNGSAVVESNINMPIDYGMDMLIYPESTGWSGGSVNGLAPMFANIFLQANYGSNIWNTDQLLDPAPSLTDLATGSNFRLRFGPDWNLNEIQGNISSTSVSSIPVPAALWLFGSGLIGLAGFARRYKYKN